VSKTDRVLDAILVGILEGFNQVEGELKFRGPNNVVIEVMLHDPGPQAVLRAQRISRSETGNLRFFKNLGNLVLELAHPAMDVERAIREFVASVTAPMPEVRFRWTLDS
jgi:hypothetical protein